MDSSRIRFSRMIILAACVAMMGLTPIRSQAQMPYYYKCSGESLPGGIFGDVPLTGVYGNINGTDSVLRYVTLQGAGISVPVFVFPAYEYNVVVDTCDSYVWYVRNQPFRSYTSSASDMVNQPVTFTYTDLNDGLVKTITCDSVARLTLTIHSSSSATQTEVACEQFSWVTSQADNDGNFDHGIYTASNHSDQIVLTNAAGCDSTITLDLTINHHTNTLYTDSVCEIGFSATYVWDEGKGYTESCVQPTDGVEVEYTVNYVNSVNCPSTDTLRLTLFKNDTTVEAPLVQCDSLVWHGNLYTISGLQEHIDPLVIGGVCDSVFQVQMSIYSDSAADMEYQTVAGATTFGWRGNTYTLTVGDTILRDTVLNVVHGVCDSLFAVTVNNYVVVTYDTMFCDQYNFAPRGNGNPVVVTVDTTIRDTMSTVLLDTLFIWNIDIQPTYSGMVDEEAICDSLRWYADGYAEDPGSGPAAGHLGDSLYVVSTNTPTVTLKSLSSNGLCDSVVTLKLTIYPSYTDTLATSVEDMGTVCGFYFWHDSTYVVTTPAAYYTDSTVHGCDSLIGMSIVVRPSGDSTRMVEACGSYVFNELSRIYYHDTVDTIYVWPASAANGCDSVHLLQVHIYPTYDDTLDVEVCGVYSWFDVSDPGYDADQNPTRTALYYVSDTLGPIHFATHPHASGACDSLVTIALTVLPCDTVRDTFEYCYFYLYGDSTYRASAVVYDTLPGTATNGCARIGEHHIIIHDSVSLYDTVHACYQYNWMSYVFTTTIDTVALFQTAAGCDSVMHRHIEIHDSTATSETAVICGDTTWNGIYMPEVMGTAVVYDTTVYHIADRYGCDSTVSIHLTVKANEYNTVPVTACDIYYWSSQAITQDTLLSYRTHGVATNGCDSVTTLAVNIDSSSAATLDTTVCDMFRWNTSVPDVNGHTFHGVFYNDENSAQVILPNAVGCDSVLTLHLTVKSSSTGEETLSACDSLFWNGNWYYTSGNHSTTLQGINENGCDSIVTLHLTIHEASYVVDAREACDSLWWHGYRYLHPTQSSSVLLTDMYGCDSTVTLNLTLYHSVLNALDVVAACDSLVWHGATYTANTNTPTFDTLTALHGCDSTVTLHLNILHSTAGVADTQVCDSVMWSTGVWYRTSTVFYDTLVASNGCDSVNTVTLTVLDSIVTDLFMEACDSYTWVQTGETLTMTGDYADTLTSARGCDSVVVLHLLVHHSDTTQNPYNTTNRTECNYYDWNGTRYYASGLYRFTATDQYGCDSVHWLNLVIDHAGSDTTYQSACNTYTYDGNTYFTADTLFIIDSTVTPTCNVYHWLSVTIARDTATSESVASCNSYEWTDNVNFYYHFFTDTVATVTVSRKYSGCDSVLTLHLAIHRPTMGYDSVSACDSYYGTPLQRNFTSSFDSIINLTQLNGTVNRFGCDSMLHQVVNIRHSTYDRVDTTVCQGMTWNGRYYSSDTYGPLRAYMNSDGCRHLDTLNLTVYSPDTAATDVVATCDSLVWHGNTYNISGIWYHSEDSLAHGVCDSVFVLDLTVSVTQRDTTVLNTCYDYRWNRNSALYTESGVYSDTTYGVAAGHCDSIYTLVLGIYGDSSEQVYEITCDSLTWHNTAYTSTGTYRYDTLTVAGCDSVVWLNLTVNHADTVSAHLYETACGSMRWKGRTYYVSGDYRFDTLTVAGCDSSVWMHLTVNSYDTIDTIVVNDASACDNYTWNIGGHTHHYTSSGVYFDTVQPAPSQFCGQMHRLELTILESTSDTAVSPHCGSWSYGGQIYTADTLIERGRDVGGNSSGCDSIHYMQIIINSPITVLDTHVVCDSYTWEDGVTYTTDNNTATFEVPGGRMGSHCDSVMILQLTVNYSSTHIDTLTGCDRRYWSLLGRTFYADFDTTVNLTAMLGIYNMVGCDSLVAMHISVPASSNTIDSVVSCGPYRWSNGVRYTSSIDGPTYLDRNMAGCDSLVTLHLEVYQPVTDYATDTVCDSTTWRGTTYYTNGFYVDTLTNAIHGVCDSIYNYDLTVYYTHYEPTETVVVRDNYTWPRTGLRYVTSGVYTFTVEDAVNGHCDSVYTLDLEVYRDSTVFETRTVCNRTVWRGHVLTASNTYRDTVFGAVHGVADSIYVLYLRVYTPDTVTSYVTACNDYIWWGDTLDHDNTYYHYSTNAVGGVCDSVYKLVLAINHIYSETRTAVACGGYTWRNRRYTTSGNFQDTVRRTAIGQCDSIFELFLTVNREYRVTDNQTACDEYYWVPVNRYIANDTVLVDTLYTQRQCDSIVTLNLHIERSSDRVAHRYVNSCGSYTWPLTGVTYTATTTADYLIDDEQVCDSTVRLHLNIYPVAVTVMPQEACVSYEWRGTTYSTSGSYFDTIRSSQGCDSILNLQLDIYQHNRDAVDVETACDSYTWHGTTYTASTALPTFDTLTVHGCDSTVRLDLTVYNSRSEVMIREVCDSFTWMDGVTYTASTDMPTYHTTTVEGCDSTIMLHLTIRYSTSSVFDTAVCETLTWIDGTTYTVSTNTPTYTFAGANAVGCDSTVTLHLRVNNNSETVSLNSCDSLLWNGQMYYATTTETRHFTNVAGCDSLVTYNLVVRNSDTTYDAITACDSVMWHGTTYTYRPTNAYWRLQNVVGCDSIVVLDLTLNHSNTVVFSDTACDSYQWHGVDYESSTNVGDASYVTTNMAGCDSTTWLLLTLNHATSSSFTDRGVDVYTWNGVDYTATGVYTQTLTAANGCDSVVTLTLVMIDFPIPEILVHDNRLLMVNHYPNGENGDRVDYIAYRWYRNNTLIPGATNDYYNNANYQTLSGCYYVEVPVDDGRTLWVPSNEICIGEGIEDLDETAADFTLYPNPVSAGSRVLVRCTVPHATLSVYDLQGRRLMQRTVEGEEISLPTDFPSGVYTLRMETTEGVAVVKKLIVR